MDLNVPAPLCGWLCKKSPNLARKLSGGAKQKRYITLSNARLVYSKHERQPDAPEDDGCGVIDLISNDVDISEMETLIILRPKTGTWLEGTFTGAEADRAFEFDCSHSDCSHTQAEWASALRGHVDYAQKFKLALSTKVPMIKKLPTDAFNRQASACILELEQRLSWLENFIGESASAKAKEFGEAAMTIENRIDYVQKLIGESESKEQKEIEEVGAEMLVLQESIEAQKERLLEMQETLEKFTKLNHTVGIESRVDDLEAAMAEHFEKHVEKHDEHRGVVDRRIQEIEALLTGHAQTAKEQHEAIKLHLDSHRELHEAAKVQLDSHHEASKQYAKADDHGLLEKKIADLETLIGESLEMLKKDSAGSSKTSVLPDTHQAFTTRLDNLESQLGDSTDKHAKEMKSYQRKLEDLHAAIEDCAKTDQHKDINARIRSLETELCDSVVKSVRQEEELEAAHSRIQDLHAKLSSEFANCCPKHNGVEDRIEACERNHQEHVDSLKRTISVLEAGHLQLATSYEDLDCLIRVALDHRDGKLSQVQDRLLTVENAVQEHLERLLRESPQTKSPFRDSEARLDHSSFFAEQRPESLVYPVADPSATRFTDFLQDFEKRLKHTHQDQNKARDVLEASLQERVRLEHSLRDDQTRQLKDLIAQEHLGREAMENALESCFRTLESVLGNERGLQQKVSDSELHIPQRPPLSSSGFQRLYGSPCNSRSSLTAFAHSLGGRF